jgi:DNA-binding winged helix-turn-helix (wHTH) protein
MGNSASASATSSTIHDNNKDRELVTISEKVHLTKDQYEVLNIICNTYQESVSQYMQEALVEAMRF